MHFVDAWTGAVTPAEPATFSNDVVINNYVVVLPSKDNAVWSDPV